MLALAIVLSLFVGVCLGLLGGGGSILTVPILVYVLGVEPHVAVATALVVVGVTAITGTIGHARAGRVRWMTALVFGAAGMVGAYPGGLLARYLSPGTLLGAFALLMFITALAMLRGARAPREGDSTRLPLVMLIVDGLIVGAITGLLGAGGGFLVVPALVLFGRVPMDAAVGTSLVVIVLKSAAALGGHLAHVNLDWRLAAIITTAAVMGSFVGSALVSRVSAARLRRVFAWFVLSMATFMLAQQTPLVLGFAVAKGSLTAMAAGAALVTAVIGVLVERGRPLLPHRT